MKLSSRIRQSVIRLVEASVNHSWAGGQRTEDRPGLDVELQQAKMEFDGVLGQVDQSRILPPDTLRKLQAAHYEMTCLLPRLTPQFAKNLEVAREGLAEVIAVIQKEN